LQSDDPSFDTVGTAEQVIRLGSADQVLEPSSNHRRQHGQLVSNQA